MSREEIRTRGAYVERLGPAESIRYGDVSIPAPGPTDVLVRVEATAVNRVDTFIRAGSFPTPLSLPFVIGRDLVGTVAAAGPGASGFAVGDPVWCNSLGHAGRQGAAAELAVVPADRLYHLPSGVVPAEAVAVLHSAATAYLALFTHARLRAGETVVVAGAAGSVGAALVTLAVEAGARVVATAGPGDADYCRELDAVGVVDYRDRDWAGHVRDLAPGGVDTYVDTSGVNDLENAVGLLALRGRVVLLAGMAARPVLPAAGLYTRDGAILGFVITHATVAELAAAAGALNRLFARGLLRPRRIETLPLSAAAEAHRRVEAGNMHGTRLVLVPERDGEDR